jgi:O-antigen ligase/tetratricopeptide (TPR) repeat protein
MTKWTYGLFLFLLVFAPLAFGTTEQWSQTIVGSLCIFVFLLHLQTLRRDKGSFYTAPGLLPLLLLAGYMLLQLAPLPPILLKLISPEIWELYEETIWVAQPGTWMPLSVAPKATLAEFFRFASYVAFYLITIQFLTEREKLKKTVTFIAAFAGLFSLAGILQFLFPNDNILWFLREWPAAAPRHFATYLNGNHYAALMGMILPVVLALFLANKPQVSYSSLREKIAELFGPSRSNLHILFGFSALLISASIFLTLSKGGILSTLASLLIFSLLFLVRGTGRKRSALLALFIVATLSVVTLFGWDPIFERFVQTRNDLGQVTDLRTISWQDSQNIIRDYPVTGTGFGTFIDIYSRYKTDKTEELTVDHEHNDYVELLTDGGFIGALLVGCFLISVFWRSYRQFLERRSTFSVYLYIGSLAGLSAILLHSITDFNLHIGANGLYFFFFAGLAVSVANSHSRHGKRNTDLPPLPPPVLPWTGIAITFLLAANLVFNGGQLLSHRSYAAIKEINLVQTETEQERRDLIEITSKAARFAPLEGSYRYAQANISFALGDSQTALHQYITALRLAPLAGEYSQKLGLVFDYFGEKEKAEKLLRAGLRNDFSTTERHKVFASWLLSHGKTETGLEHIRQAISLEPQKTWDYLTLMAVYGLSDEKMRKALPEQSIPRLVYGDYLIGKGKGKAAEESYRTALRYATSEERPSTSSFWRIYEYYYKRGRYEEALEVMRAGIQIFPDNTEFRYSAANLYERLGITYRAIEEYRKSLLLNPGNKTARQKLENLVTEK